MFYIFRKISETDIKAVTLNQRYQSAGLVKDYQVLIKTVLSFLLLLEPAKPKIQQKVPQLTFNISGI